jgi:hypothetical protein
MTPAALFKPIRWDERNDKMIAEKQYVVKADFILRCAGRKPVGLKSIKVRKPAPRRLEDRPLIINGREVN